MHRKAAVLFPLQFMKGKIPLFCAQITCMCKSLLLYGLGDTSMFCIGEKMLIIELKICFLRSNTIN